MKRKIVKIRKNKRGFTLVELIVAVLLMAMISTSLSSILGSTLTMYNRAEMRSVLYNVSQKIHIALDNELIASRDLTLYQNAQQPRNLLSKEFQYCLQVQNGYLYVYSYNEDTKRIEQEHILLSEKSYRGATVKEFYIRYDKIKDKVEYSDSTEKECWRILYITTTITRNGVDYTHTSTIRLYNMAVYGTELMIKTANRTDPYVPSAKLSTKFPFVMYYATQYFEV